MPKARNLLIDFNNMCHYIRHGATMANVKDDDYWKPLCFLRIVQSVAYSVRELKATGLIIAADGKNNWRKKIYPDYKGRRDHSTDPFYEDLKEVMAKLIEFFETCTAIPVISVEGAEADDVIAVLTQELDDDFVIWSTDKDMIQLCRNGVELWSAVNKDFRKCDDIHWSLFLKCFRGEQGKNSDNIPTCWVRLRETKIRAAYDDPVEKLNLFESLNPDGMKVSDLFARNEQLIDLRKQPDEVRESIRTAIGAALTTQKSYNSMAMMKFCAGADNKYRTIVDDLAKIQRVFNLGFDC